MAKNPFSQKAKKKKKRKPNPFSERAKDNKPKVKLQDIKPESVDGVVGIQIQKPSEDDTWEYRKFKKREREGKESDKHDTTIDGVKICHVREHEGFWTIDAINGDETARFDNHIGSWVLEIRAGRLWREPVLWLRSALHARWHQELERQDRDPYQVGQPKIQRDKEGKKKTKQLRLKQFGAKGDKR